MTDPTPPRKPFLDDDVLRAAYQIATSDRAGHVTDGEWEQLACGELDDATKQRVLSHALSCATCSMIHRSLIALGEESTSFDPQSVTGNVPPAFAWRRWAVGGGLAAAALIMIAVLIDDPARRRVPPDVTRTTDAGTIEITRPLALPDRQLAWTAVANADGYEVRLNNAAGAPAWTARVTAASAELPATISLTPGTYYLQVSALREGVIIATSRLVSITVN